MDDVKPPPAYTLSVNRVGVLECGVSQLCWAFLILFERLTFPRLSFQIIDRNIAVETSPAFYLLCIGRCTRLWLEKNFLSLAKVRYTVTTLSAI